MSKPKTQSELLAHKTEALNAMDNYLTSLIQSNNPSINGKADKLCYWIQDYCKFLNFEPTFTPTSLKRYKRGEIIQVHLGYKVGSEEGGLHYALVLDNENSINSPVITIVPLTSIKPNKDLTRLRKGELNLGDILYQKLYAKALNKLKSMESKNQQYEDALASVEENSTAYNLLKEQRDNDADISQSEFDLVNKIILEIKKMKTGSIALLNQITTISKIRIYDPKTTHDVLSGIRLPDDELDRLDAAIIDLYTKKIKKCE